jgi:hypothetical protein
MRSVIGALVASGILTLTGCTQGSSQATQSNLPAPTVSDASASPVETTGPLRCQGATSTAIDDYAPSARGAKSPLAAVQPYVGVGEHAVLLEDYSRWDVRIVDEQRRTTAQIELWSSGNGWLVSTHERCAGKR